MPRLLGLLLVFCLGASALAQNLTHVRIRAADPEALAARLEAAGFDVLEGGISDDAVDVVASDAELNGLRVRGLRPEFIARGRPFRDIQAEQQGAGPDIPPGYPTLDEAITAMNAAAAAFPAICKVVDLTTTYGMPTTHEGRKLFAVKISDNVNADEDEPSFLMVSCHHAREIVTPVIALDAIERLTTGYGSNPTITSLVNSYEIWIIPIANPDGYRYMFDVNNLWRKNRRVFPQGTGVDQNRNYPFGWSAPCAGSTTVTSDTYKGPSPASEAETQTIIALSSDRHFTKVLDYHSSGRETLYAYRCLTHPFTSFLQQQAVAISSACGYGSATRTPSAEGQEQEWQLAARGAMAYLVETHTTFQPSYASAQAEAAMVWPGTLWFLQRAIPVRGHVTDALSGQPVVADINYLGVNFPNGEKNSSEPRFGRYHCFLPAGPFTIEFSAPGYVTQTKAVTVTATTEQVVEVQLQPVAPPCYADCNGDGQLNLADFGCFQTRFATGQTYADCNGDGQLNLADFGCFQTKFALGCP